MATGVTAVVMMVSRLPCYGYKAKVFRHPNPAKAAKGFTKSRLEPDGPCGETVYDHLGTDAIADLLNYLCPRSNNNRGRPDNYLGHPKTLYLREDALLEAVTAFFAAGASARIAG